MFQSHDSSVNDNTQESSQFKQTHPLSFTANSYGQLSYHLLRTAQTLPGNMYVLGFQLTKSNSLICFYCFQSALHTKKWETPVLFLFHLGNGGKEVVLQTQSNTDD